PWRDPSAKERSLLVWRKFQGAASGTAVTLHVPAVGALPRLVLAAASLAAYIALEWVSFIHDYKGVPVTPWNPGLGAVFALMLFAGWRFGAVLFAGVIIAHIAVLRSSLSWPIILGIAAIIATGYAATAAVMPCALALDG